MIEHVTTKREAAADLSGRGPGVGKTYITRQAHHGRGTDAVVGAHGRSKDREALLGGIEMIRRISGCQVSRTRYWAVLRRHPQVAGGELAHTITPGGKTQAGGTFRKSRRHHGDGQHQHPGGLNDVVEQITGIERRRRSPGRSSAADQVAGRSWKRCGASAAAASMQPVGRPRCRTTSARAI